MNDHHRVLPRLDDFVEITDCTMTRRRRQWPVDPDRFLATNEKSAGEVTRREIVVTSNSHQRASESRRHVLDEPRLPAAGRALEHHWKAALMTFREQRDLVACGQ